MREGRSWLKAPRTRSPITSCYLYLKSALCPIFPAFRSFDRVPTARSLLAPAILTETPCLTLMTAFSGRLEYSALQRGAELHMKLDHERLWKDERPRLSGVLKYDQIMLRHGAPSIGT